MYLFPNPTDASRSQSKAAALGQFNPRAQFIQKALHANINLTGTDLAPGSYGILGYGGKTPLFARRLSGSDPSYVTAFSSGGSPTMLPRDHYDGVRGYGARPPLTARPLRGYGARPPLTARPLAYGEENVQIRGLGAAFPKKIYIRQLLGLGQAPIGPGLITSPDATVVQDIETGFVTDTATGNVYDANGNLVAQGQAAMPTQGSGSAAAAAYQSVLTSAQNSQNPLDYVSPQAAIAAGLPASTVNAAWAAQMARYPSTTAAIAAGIPAGVVTQLWAQSRTAVAAQPASWLTQAPFGIPNSTLLLIGGGFLVLSMLGGSHGYRRR
jgi:hypothetical protein